MLHLNILATATVAMLSAKAVTSRAIPICVMLPTYDKKSTVKLIVTVTGIFEGIFEAFIAA